MLTFDELIVAGSDSGQYFRPMAMALETSLYLKCQVLIPVAELQLDDLRNQFSTPENPYGLEKHLHGDSLPGHLVRRNFSSWAAIAAFSSKTAYSSRPCSVR